jgi:hypothetical protein
MGEPGKNACLCRAWWQGAGDVMRIRTSSFYNNIELKCLIVD